ncbi:MAG: hypothetical protein ABIH87_04225 [bacterium]
MKEGKQVDISSDFETKKTNYFARFAYSHFDSLQPHEKGEVLGHKGDLEIWRNVSEHCLVASVFADILAEELGLEKEQREAVVEAAMLHDWFKKYEVKAMGVVEKEGKLDLRKMEEIKREDQRLLQEMGIPEDIINLAGANIPETTQGPKTLSEKIIWYVDAMLSDTEPVSIAKRFKDLKMGWDGQKENPERARRNAVFSDLYKERYDDKSLFEVQQEVGEKIGTEFKRLLNYTGEVDDLPFFLKEILIEKINISK